VTLIAAKNFQQVTNIPLFMLDVSVL